MKKSIFKAVFIVAVSMSCCIALFSAPGKDASENVMISTGQAGYFAEQGPPAAARHVQTTSRDMWDIQFSYDLVVASGDAGNAGSEFDGTYFYSTRWSSNLLHQYDTAGNLLKEFSISGVSGLRDLAWDGQYLYGGAASTTIYCIDPIAETLITTITSPVAVRSIAYDSGNDAFWVNNWEETLSLVNRSGVVIDTIDTPPSMYSSAYDNVSPGGPFLWIFTGTSSGLGCQLEQYDLNTKTLTGVTHSLTPDFGQGIAGGLFFTTEYAAGFATLGGLMQGDGAQDTLFGYEAGEAALLGIVTGPGPAFSNAPSVRVFPPEQDATYIYEFNAYGTPHYGTNVTCGDVDGDGADEILTGPGPGNIYGPHIRGFEVDGTPLQGLSFIAYGTLKWGANVACGDIDYDGYDEIVTGPGPGAVFGPHVRGFNYDGGPSITPMSGVSFIAYGTRKWGVNVTCGNIDGENYVEIVTGAGPGAVFGPHVRGWNVDGGTATPIPEVSFIAYGTRKFGVRVGSGNVDGDGYDEIITGPGPSNLFGPHVRGWNYDNASIEPLPGYSFFAWPAAAYRYGVKVYAGANLNMDGRDELVAGPGPDPGVGCPAKVFVYDGALVTEWISLDAYPGWTMGTNVAAGSF